MLLAQSRPAYRNVRHRHAAWPHAAGAAAALLLFGLWMWALGRPLFCPCGTVRLWAPQHDSQHLSDWYSLLHVSFGLGLFVLIDRVQPGWPALTKAFVALLSSLAWEAIENLPAVIALFNTPGASGSYAGDSIVNAFSDTLFVMAGFTLAARVPGWASLALFLGLELVVWLAIGDGLAVGSARLLTG